MAQLQKSHTHVNSQQLPSQQDVKCHIHCREAGGSGLIASLTAELEASSSGPNTRLHLTDSPLLPHCGHTTAMQSMETKLTLGKCHSLEILELVNNELNQTKLIIYLTIGLVHYSLEDSSSTFKNNCKGVIINYNKLDINLKSLKSQWGLTSPSTFYGNSNPERKTFLFFEPNEVSSCKHITSCFLWFQGFYLKVNYQMYPV